MPQGFILDPRLISGLRLKGNPVQIRDGPAAVTGDEHRMEATDSLPGWEGAISRMNRESEDLSERSSVAVLVVDG
jgi:hypothetical protein